ncbi:Uncharacterised protein [Actinomadura madurae]|nr:Uncharacterised protein [Actinomadura madurae]
MGAGVHGPAGPPVPQAGAVVAGRGGEQTGTRRRWGLPLADRVLLIAVYYRTNLTLRQVALLLGVSKSAAHRVVDHLAPPLAPAPVARPRTWRPARQRRVVSLASDLLLARKSGALEEKPVGVLTDYFRAADAEVVVQAMKRLDGGPLVGTGSPAFDGVEAKGVDPAVVLGKLIGAIKQVPWSVRLVEDSVVWPTTPAPGPEGPWEEDDPWATGPWVSELDNAARDALAGVRDADVSKVVAEWVQAEELHGAHADDMEPLATELIQLARRARDAGDHLYSWVCL